MYVTYQISVIHILTIRFNSILHPQKPQYTDVAVGYQAFRSFLHYLDLNNV